MPYAVGIDGGGSTVRAVIVDETLTVLGQAQGPTANPNAAGQAAAAAHIQAAIRAALAEADVAAPAVTAVCAGVWRVCVGGVRLMSGRTYTCHAMCT